MTRSDGDAHVPSARRQGRYPNDLAEMRDWIAGATPPGGRVLEIGSGDGALVRELATNGIDVVGVDPHAEPDDHVKTVGVEDLDAAPFDVIFAGVSLHHLPDPAQTTRTLERLSKPGTMLLVREFDRLLLDDEATLTWWYHQRRAHDAVTEPDPEAEPVPDSFTEFEAGWRHDMSHHVLPWAVVLGAIEGAGFITESQHPVPYLFRWGLTEPARSLEAALIDDHLINPVGIRWSGRRHAP